MSLVHDLMASSPERDLRRIQKQADSYGKRIDLTSDVLTLFATVGIKSVRLMSASTKVAGNSKSLLGMALNEQEKIAFGIADDFSRFIEGQFFNNIGSNEAALAHKAIRSTGPKTADLVKFAKTGLSIKNSLLSVARVADILLDYTSPSTIAKWWTGFDETMKQSTLAVSESKSATLHLLADKILKRRKEGKIVWGQGTQQN